jgi:hypothetical protein
VSDGDTLSFTPGMRLRFVDTGGEYSYEVDDCGAAVLVSETARIRGPVDWIRREVCAGRLEVLRG